jgi:putative transposase
MYLVERHNIKKEHKLHSECDRVCFLSKNLYNYSNYIVRQEYIKTSKLKEQGEVEYATYLNYNAINKLHIKEAQHDYISLPRKVSNETLKALHNNWMSFFASIKDWSKNKDKYKGVPRIPSYLHKTKGRYKVTYENQAISKRKLKKGILSLSGTGIEIPYINKEYKPIEVRIIPKKNNLYIIEVVYEKKEKEKKKDGIKCGVDLGINNIMAITFSLEGESPILIKGGQVKSINQYYNKKKSLLQSPLTKQYGEKRQTSNAINKLTSKRNNKINDFFHKASRTLVRVALEKDVSDIVIGKNKGWKDEINIGNKNNQNFVCIPHEKLIQMIKYKCELEGINVIVREESYTSKSSFLDMDDIPTFDKDKRGQYTFSGHRLKRGLYISKEGKQINADVNGSYNTNRKEFPNVFSDGIEGFAVNPVVVKYTNVFL